MKKKTLKKWKGIVGIGFGLAVAAGLGVLYWKIPDNRPWQYVILEAGAPLPQPEDFLIKQAKAETSFVSDISSIDTKVPGDYTVELASGRFQYSSVLQVRDTVSPLGGVKELTLSVGETCVPTDFLEWAERAVVLTGEADPEISLCHGEYTYHHLLFRGRSTAVVDFSHMGWGVPLSDLYLYLRKNMEKQNWRFPLGKEMLEIYERLCPMGEDGRRYLYARLAYPEKFWKQVNSYYNRRKSWIPVRNLEKLRTLEVQKEKKEQFLAQLAAFWGIS